MQLSKLFSACVIGLTGTLAANQAVASTVLVDYISAASTSNATISANNVATGLTADALSAGSGLTANSGGSYNWKDWDTASDSFADAVAANDFWTWGFDVTGDIAYTLNTMDIRLDRSGSGPDDVEIQGSVNGGTAVSLLTHDYGDSGSGVNFTNINLSGLGTVSQGDSVVFTLAAFNSESSGGTFDLENNGSTGIVISGTETTVPDTPEIPEPAAMLLGLVGMATLATRRRQ